MKTLQTSIYQLLAGLDTFKREIQHEQCTNNADIVGNLSSLRGDLSRLSGTVEEIQSQLLAIGTSMTHVTKTGDDVAEELPLLTTLPPTTQGYLDHAMQSKFYVYIRPGPEVIKLFSCSSQLSIKFKPP